MKTLKKAVTWCLLLNKRFLKKGSFLAILALVPLLVIGLRSVTAGQDSGIVTVALCPGEDETSRGIVAELLEEKGVLRFLSAEDEDAARDLVASGTADAAWIFAADTEREIDRAVAGRKAAAVTVVEREDNIFLMLSREKLYSVLFPAESYALFLDLLREEAAPEEPSDEELTAYYRHTEKEREIIRFSYMDGSEAEGTDLLLSPVRGLLALLLVLGGMAAGVFLVRDRAKGAFTWVRPGGVIWLRNAYLLLPMADLALVIYAALLLSGLSVGWAYELLLLGLLTLAGAGFCLLVCRLCGTPERISVAALILMMCMLAFCPVFMNMRRLRIVSHLFPPFYYLHAVHNRSFAGFLALYALALWGINALLDLLSALRRRN